MNHLALYVPNNTPGINPRTGHEWHDGDEFLSEAQNYAEYWRAVGDTVDLAPIRYQKDRAHRPMMREAVTDAFGYDVGKYGAVAIFCHGTSNGIQIGYRVSDKSVAGLAYHIRCYCTADVIVSLYCCSTAHDRDRKEDEEIGPGTDGGFADELTEELCRLDYSPRVFAHLTAGHTTRNPRVVKFGRNWENGRWIVKPGSGRWKYWVNKLKGDFRFGFPFMPLEEFEGEIDA